MRPNQGTSARNRRVPPLENGKEPVCTARSRAGPVPGPARLLTPTCPRRQAGKLHDPCGVRFPQVPGLFPEGADTAGTRPGDMAGVGPSPRPGTARSGDLIFCLGA